MSDYPAGPAYRIQTQRLVLRCWNPPDAPLLKEAVDSNRPYLLPWMPWAAGEPEPPEVHLQRIRRWRANFDQDQDYIYGIFNLDETQVLGGTGLHTRIGDRALEIGYWIDWQHRLQGLATETAAALTRVAFEVQKVLRLEIHCDPRNLASAAVPRKLGFTLEATLRARTEDHLGAWTDSMIWTMLADEYPSSPAALANLEAYNAAGQRIL
jgi:RimJ/RimL family protein N-acetyltransferase